MGRALKIYGWTSFYPRDFTDRTKNCRMFVAATSQRAAAEAAGTVPHRLQNIGSSGNDQEIQVAMEFPGVVFFWDELNHAPRDRVPVRLECGEMFADHQDNACRCTLGGWHVGAHRGVVVTEAAS